MDPRNEAVRLLIFYMRRAWEAADLAWERDNDAEMEALVDFIVEAARGHTL